MKPVIGVVPLFDEKRDSYWILPGYMTGIEEAGGIPVMLPMNAAAEDLQQLAGQTDGFLFTGGHDVSPALYHETAHPECCCCCPERDRLESDLYRIAREKEKPILGICRGIQMINVLEGGTLWQDLPTQHPSAIDHHGKPPYDVPVHEVTVMEGTPLYELCGKHMAVNSYHHQAIRVLAPGLKAMAVAEDGIIEAVYAPGTFLWAVQFHPEFSYRKDKNCRRIFERFVQACEEK